MKKLQSILIVTGFLFLLSCDRPHETLNPSNNASLQQSTDKGEKGNLGEGDLKFLHKKNESSRARTNSSSCGTTLSGSYSLSAYSYTYPDQLIDLSDRPVGSSISLTCYSFTLPNRFSIVDGNGNTVVPYTPWYGAATYSGPWGGSLNNPGQPTLTFTKSSNTMYFIRVQTGTQYESDAWEAAVACAGTCSPPSALSGNYNSNVFYYKYPDQQINVSGISDGLTVILTCYEYDVPNRIRVVDGNGNVVGQSTGWFGTASYSGPWGPSLNNGGQRTITFTKNSGTSYYLQVETGTQNSPGADAWEVSFSCAY